MNVKSIFKVLIIAVGCVVIGAFILNILLPTATKQLVNGTENMIYRATGLSFDFNGDGIAGGSATTITDKPSNSSDSIGPGVEGFTTAP